jgi:nucleoside phosphorylase
MAADGFDALFVPRGAEFAAVRKGVQGSRLEARLIAIPAGAKAGAAVAASLAATPRASIAVLGLCGSLREGLPVGATVEYEECIDREGDALACDGVLPIALATPRVRGFTAEHVVWRAVDKRDTHARYDADVVDMEGVPILTALEGVPTRVAMLRVVSDDARYDLPNLENSIDEDGNLLPVALTGAFLRAPGAAFAFIRDVQASLKALTVLAERLAAVTT